MYFRIPFLSLLFATVAMVTSQDGLPTGHKSRHQSVLSKCTLLLETGPPTIPQRRGFLPLVTLCHQNKDKYYDCLLENIYESNSTIDIQVRNMADFSKVKVAQRTACREAMKLKEETRSCDVPARKCESQPRVHGRINKDFASICRIINRRCLYNELAKCDLQRTMLYAKFEMESLSIGCLLSDPKIQLIPSYGPESKCYSSINVDDIEPTDYGQIFERYCNQFDYTDVSTCIEETLSNITSEELWENKESYMKKARQFVNDRHLLCRKLAALPSRECLNPTYKPDVSSCQNMLFIPPSRYSVWEITRFYALCVQLTYAPCNLNLGSLIYSNLMTYVS